MEDKKLEAYRKKRDFTATPEPAGRVKRHKSRDLRFSVQHHIARADHYDLRLELDGVALSWAVPKGPSFRTADKRLALRVEDHPVDYMDFEGVIPKGQYGGGTVMLWDEGTWTPRFDPEKGLREGSLKFRLDGRRLKGDWALVRIKSEEKGDAWLLIKERDEFAKRSAGISAYGTGVRSGMTMSEIRRASGTMSEEKGGTMSESLRSKTKNPFQSANVMLARLVDALPSDAGWVYELKYDGHRTLAYLQGGAVRLDTRNGHDRTDSFPAVVQALKDRFGTRAAVLDGEMVVAGENGVPDFSALQSYVKSGKGEGLCYVLFDLLALDGEDFRDRPLLERKKKLKELLRGAPPVLSYSEHTEKMTERDVRAIEKSGMEGVVAKRADSPYAAGKNGDWVKLKFRKGQEFVIGGYTKGEDGLLRSLLVGYYQNDALVFAGSVGTGFGESERKTLTEALSAIEAADSPFETPKRRKNAVWTVPLLAAQVEFAEMTAAGLLRQASFCGLRQDKDPKEIVLERPSVNAKGEKKPTHVRKPTSTSARKGDGKDGATLLGITVTHPEKVMFPEIGLRKGDLAAYYAEAAPHMLPYVKDRLLSLVCCPAGIEKESFFRRHLEGEFAGVKFALAEDGEEFFYAVSGKGILSLVQYNAVEFHIRGCKKGAEKPDIMVFDLDPDEGLSLREVRRGVREVGELIKTLGLRSFLKTSGGKGYHIVVPIRSGVKQEDFRDFSKKAVEILEREHPDRYTSSLSKAARKGKIFIDWQRNTQGATFVAPYSVRARRGAPVSMPIAWEELGKIAPDGITVKTALRRMENDPWKDFFAVKKAQSLR